MKNVELQAIARDNKINLNHFDEVHAFINEKWTWLYVSFALRENVGGRAYHCGQIIIKKSIAAMLKKDIDPTDYCTQGWEYINEIAR